MTTMDFSELAVYLGMAGLGVGILIVVACRGELPHLRENLATHQRLLSNLHEGYGYCATDQRRASFSTLIGYEVRAIRQLHARILWCERIGFDWAWPVV
jgi:hypothetical protein